MPRQTSLTPDQKQKISELQAQGMSQRKIADQLGIGYPAVRNYLEKGVSPEIEEKVDQLVTTALVAPAPAPTTRKVKQAPEPDNWSDEDPDLDFDEGEEAEPEPEEADRPSRKRKQGSRNKNKPRRGSGSNGEQHERNYKSPILAPDFSVFQVKTGLEWMHQQVGALLEETSDVYDQLYIFDRLFNLYSKAEAKLESLYNLEMIDSFIREVTAILEEQSPEARQRLYRKLEECGLAAGAILLEPNSKTS